MLADVAALRELRGAELRALGRLPYPMMRRQASRASRRIAWDEALDLIAERIRAGAPERIGFYLTSRGMPNETYYAAQKAVRAIGTNSIDNAARICHSPSTFALKDALGVGASTCSYTDWIGTDLIVFIGSNVANNQPVTTKYMYDAKKAGTKIVVVNPLPRAGDGALLDPVEGRRAPLFGTKIADELLRSQHRRRHRLPERRAQAHDRDAARSTRNSSTSTPSGFDEARAMARGGRAGRTSRPSPAPAASEMRAFARHARRGPKRRCSSGAWASPSTSAARTTSARSSTWR